MGWPTLGDFHMGYLLGLLAVVLIAGAWWLTRALAAAERNEGSTHGGGFPDSTPFTEADVD